MSTAWATIIGAVVAAAASILVSYINNKKQTALIAYRLEQLEKKVEKHNNLVERMTITEERLKEDGRRIAELERRNAS